MPLTLATDQLNQAVDADESARAIRAVNAAAHSKLPEFVAD